MSDASRPVWSTSTWNGQDGVRSTRMQNTRQSAPKRRIAPTLNRRPTRTPTQLVAGVLLRAPPKPPSFVHLSGEPGSFQSHLQSRVRPASAANESLAERLMRTIVHLPEESATSAAPKPWPNAIGPGCSSNGTPSNISSSLERARSCSAFVPTWMEQGGGNAPVAATLTVDRSAAGAARSVHRVPGEGGGRQRSPCSFRCRQQSSIGKVHRAAQLGRALRAGRAQSESPRSLQLLAIAARTWIWPSRHRLLV